MTIAEYRLPKEAGQASSTVLTLTQAGDTFTARGGKFGPHAITTTDRSRVRAHWAGYVSNNRGRTVPTLAPIRFQEVK